LVTVYDKAGNKNETEVRKIGLDYLGPSIGLINPKAKAYGYNVSLPLNYNVNDAIVGTDVCWYNIDDGSNVTVDCSGSANFNATNGQHTLYFYANDTFGNMNSKNVTFLLSIYGPAVQLVDPADNSFYAQATEVFFNYIAEDPDLTEQCSLYGSWNGGWHLNQTDLNWIIGETKNETEDFEAYVSGNTVFSLNWSNTASGDACSWHADNDGTASTGTGPGSSATGGTDHTLGTTEGIYAYMETSASAPSGISDTCGSAGLEAFLISDLLDADLNNYNISFWYHMLGTAMGSLHLDVYDGSWQNSVWSISGDQGDVWNNQVVDLSDYEGVIQLRFRGIRGSDFTSDIALDDIKIISTPGGNKPYGNFSVNLSEEGTHEWNVKCNDTNSYDSWGANNFSITFDVTNPVVDFGLNTLADNSNVSQNFIYVNSSIVENNYDSMEFYLYNDTGLVSSVWFNDSTSDYTFTNLDDGAYYYNMTVWDGANRNGSSLTRQVLLDTTAPTGSVNTPSDNSIVNNATQNLTGSFSDLNGLEEVVLFVYNQSGFVYSQVVPLVGVVSATVGVVYEFLVDGIYEWFYGAEDTIGNQYNTTNNSIVIDTTLPTIDFISETADDGSFLVQDFVYVNTSVVETNFDNITFALYNGEGVVSPTGIFTFSTDKRDINYTNLAEDEYFYNVTVWDKAGNVNSSETRVINLDRTLPVVSYGSDVEDNNANVSQDFVYVNTSVVETNFDNITFSLYSESAHVANYTFQDGTRDYNFTGIVTDGDYYYNVTVYDKAGQSKSTATRKISLDDTSPLVDFGAGTAADGSVFERDWVYVESNVFEVNLKNMSFNLYDNESALINSTNYDSLVNNINFTASGENKTYYYDIVVYDWAGNKGQSVMRNITLIDVTAPSLILNSPENITYPYTNGIRLDYEVYDAHIDSCWYSLDGAPNATLPNCQGISMDFADFTGHTVDLYVNDTMGYMNSSSVTFFVNSSLIETPTYKVLRGSSFVDGSVTETIDITDMSKSFVLHTTRGGDSAPDSLRVISSFPRSDQVEFSNYESGSGAIVDWSVVSGPGIEAQRGEISFTNENSLPLSIGAVNLSSSFVIVNVKMNSGVASENIDTFFSAKFVDDSNVVFERTSGSTTGVLGWQVVDWSGVQVEAGSLKLEAGSSANQTAITQVNLNKSVLIFSNNLAGDNSVEDVFVKGEFVNDTTLNFSRVGSGGDVNISYFVLESDLFEVQSGDYTHLENSNVQPISLSSDLINVRRSFDVHSHENDGALTSFASGFVTQQLVDNKTINLQKGIGSDSGVTSWFAVEIKDLNNPIVNLSAPVAYNNYSSHTVGPFSYVIDDESNMSNCSFYGSWNGGWHLNQTIDNVDSENPVSFAAIEMTTSGFYNWSVSCIDIYGNSFMTTNRTFSSFLPPSEPLVENITQTTNDGTGDVFLDWSDVGEAVSYKIYSGSEIGNLSFLTEVTASNFTDVAFAGNKRRFYRVEAWNPSATNLSSKTFGAHVYELKHNIVAINVKSRNWIGFPTNFSYLKNANDTLNEMNGITAISRLKVDTQTIQSCNEFSCPESLSCTDTACNFDLKVGEGYEVLLNESEAAVGNWSGVGVVQEPAMISLTYDETGTRYNKNWISMYAGTTMNTAIDLAESILGEDAINGWDSEKQESVGLIPNPFPWISGDYLGGVDIEIEGGYEVSVVQDSAWTQQ
jgi:hypothetical protein